MGGAPGDRVQGEESCDGRRNGGTKEEERRVRWRRLECPRTTNGADTTGLPFTAYLPVVSLRLRTFNVHALYISPSPFVPVASSLSLP